MDSSLLLYVDEDFIIPVACDTEGQIQSMAKDGDDRLWLYFASMPSGVDYAFKYRNNFVAGEPGYYGDFFKAAAEGKKVQINGYDMPYFELLRQSSFLQEIRDIFRMHTGATSAIIPTFFVFADSIPAPVRKDFLQSMEKESFRVRSFSALPAAVLSDYVRRSSMGMEAEFGDYILYIFSAADSLRLSHSVWDGENWLADGFCQEINSVGDAPLKDALVKYVVDEVDKNRGYLAREDARLAEYAHQRKNADKWLALQESAKVRNPKALTVDFDIDDFTYSQDSAMRFSCHVSGNFLAGVQENAVRSTVKMIADYVEKNAIKGHLRTAVFFGKAFDDERFVKMVWDTLENPEKVVIPSNRMGKAMGCFYPEFTATTEDIDSFDSVTAKLTLARAGIREWIKVASRIRDLWMQLKAHVPNAEKVVAADTEKVTEMLRMCGERLAHSDFDAAQDRLQGQLIPSEDARNKLVESGRLASLVADMQAIFAKIQGIAGARNVANQINSFGERLSGIIQGSKANEKALRDAVEKIQFFREHFAEYKELLSQFNRSKNLMERKELVEKMRPLTMEELPAIELPHVTARVTYRVEKRRVSFFKKKRWLMYWVDVLNEEALPCDAMLNISSTAMLEARNDCAECIGIVIPKGTARFEREICIDDDSRISTASKAYIYINPVPKELDRKAIQAEDPLMSVNLKV